MQTAVFGEFMKNIIELKDVNFSYGKTLVLENLSFEVEKGEIVGIIGSNGAGKTTLIKLMIGQLSPQKGSIKVFDTQMNNICKYHNIGYVPQSQDKNKINFPATVLEVVMMNLYKQVGLFRFYKKEHRQKALKALELVGMNDFQKRLISQLSGGQRQRVMIARAIVNNPHMLILDEPTTGVDKESSKLIYELLKELNQKFNLTIIMISHDTKNLKRYCTSIYEIDYGSINKV